MGAKVLNELTGEAVLTDGEGRAYNVVFDLSAVMAVEALTGRSAIDILSGRPNVTDCVAMIIAGSAGWQRRNPGGRRINDNLAKRILIDSGGLVKVAPTLADSMSCAEGLGLGADLDEGEGDEADPLASEGS